MVALVDTQVNPQMTLVASLAGAHHPVSHGVGPSCHQTSSPWLHRWLTPPLAPNPAASTFLDNNAGSDASTWSQPLLSTAGWARQRKSWHRQKQDLFILRWPQQPGKHGKEWAARPQQTIELYQVRSGCRGCESTVPLAKAQGHLHLI